MNVIKKEEYLNIQIDNLLNMIKENDFEDVEDMKQHIEKLNKNVLLLIKIIEFV